MSRHIAQLQSPHSPLTVKDEYSCHVILRSYSHSHSPLKCLRGTCPLYSTVRPLPVADAPGDKPPCTVQRDNLNHTGTKQYGLINFNHTHMKLDSPLLPILLAMSRSLHRHPSSSQGNLHTFHPVGPRSAPHQPSYHSCLQSTPFYIGCRSSILFMRPIQPGFRCSTLITKSLSISA